MARATGGGGVKLQDESGCRTLWILIFQRVRASSRVEAKRQPVGHLLKFAYHSEPFLSVPRPQQTLRLCSYISGVMLFEQQDEIIPIISARKAVQKERKRYDENRKKESRR